MCSNIFRLRASSRLLDCFCATKLTQVGVARVEIWKILLLGFLEWMKLLQQRSWRKKRAQTLSITGFDLCAASCRLSQCLESSLTFRRVDGPRADWPAFESVTCCLTNAYSVPPPPLTPPPVPSVYWRGKSTHPQHLRMDRWSHCSVDVWSAPPARENIWEKNQLHGLFVQSKWSWQKNKNYEDYKYNGCL